MKNTKSDDWCYCIEGQCLWNDGGVCFKPEGTPCIERDYHEQS